MVLEGTGLEGYFADLVVMGALSALANRRMYEHLELTALGWGFGDSPVNGSSFLACYIETRGFAV